MSLIVEDGSVVPDADTFLSLVSARDLAGKYGVELPVADSELEVLLRKSYLNLLNSERTLQGERVSGTQTGIFPRLNVYNNCNLVDSDVIPKEVLMAQLYSSEGINAGANTNEITTGERLKSFAVVGAYTETYQDGSSASMNARIQGVINSLYPLTKTGFASSPCGGGGGVNVPSYGFLG